uniref:Uncharacterized protein n=1 Tax=Arundo donax TaxID=35708 RepID=A0A0A9CW59_ARUDO
MLTCPLVGDIQAILVFRMEPFWSTRVLNIPLIMGGCLPCQLHLGSSLLVCHYEYKHLNIHQYLIEYHNLLTVKYQSRGMLLVVHMIL